ncbi:multicopper oxidase family protein [Deinococcus yavapaiensis]|uniref:FtsP/CotA-like multicopper oxidase with cupredoxin domain n=1 Tax=Deinococcus yavapaiensis KR-236 TaxID=694435 RepID=A0A318S8T0_9DEIO|nr:multicopper oxidase domain-containing protein [Deinococcus yavapaiensis]PYE55447.1 FtsP/CotA-like multicopper oxidase with cupredoxin domain [Deinococcus yavapaiensis KR-236]
MLRSTVRPFLRAALLGVLTLGSTFASDAVPTRDSLISSFLSRREGTVPLAEATRGVREFTLEVHRIKTEIAPGETVEQWAFSFPGQAPSVPGPELRVKLGERVRITLKNTHDQPHAVHLHGITSLAQEMDGVPHLSGRVMPNGSYTYEFVATEAGTFAYHCHEQTNVHLDMGMYGALVVEDPDHPHPWTAEHTLILDEWDSHHDDPARAGYTPRYDTFLVNGKSFPLIPDLAIPAGETHLVRFIAMGSEPHSLHLHGTSFLVIAKDGHDLPLPYVADTLPILPGERYDLLVKGRDGTFPWHDHNANANTNAGVYPGGMHFDVVGSPALRADGTPATTNPHAGHGMTSATVATSAASSSDSAPSSATVTISNFEFGPEDVVVSTGGRVTWQNDDEVAHVLVVSLNGAEQRLDLPAHGHVTITFPAAGRVAYHCLPHPFMTGSVDVR